MPSYYQIIAHYKENQFDREAIGLIMFDEERVIYRFKKLKDKMVVNVSKQYHFENYTISDADYLHKYCNGLIRFEKANLVNSVVTKVNFNKLFSVLIN